jgi:hypothetical protein
MHAYVLGAKKKPPNKSAAIAWVSVGPGAGGAHPAVRVGLVAATAPAPVSAATSCRQQLQQYLSQCMCCIVHQFCSSIQQVLLSKRQPPGETVRSMSVLGTHDHLWRQFFAAN